MMQPYFQNLDVLKTGASVLAIVGVLALSQPAFADTQYGPFKESFELAYNDNHDTDEKEDSHEVDEKYDSEVEQVSSEESEQSDGVDEEDEADDDEENHTDARGGWWEGVTDWFTDLRS